ncbi:MAG: Rpn family recombination-promoting nuclease/putative transposase, partial [Oscillospiraceae bacterium]|nr:Rpn family recombination-promoting nuclease/putative transposase [Oscillospiraceae bacterium]
MTQLKYTLTNDILFKMLFTKYPWLLKRLVAELLRIEYESIWQFEIINSEIPPEIIGSKFCRLDINMLVNGQRVDLEIQQEKNKGYFPERSLFYWARDYSSSLPEGENYGELPCTIIISILNFKQFDCKEYYSEFPPLEIKRHTKLTDKMRIIYYELPKLPRKINANNILELLLHLFNAKTEEALMRIEKLEVSFVQEVIDAYRSVTASAEFRELERLRSK